MIFSLTDETYSLFCGTTFPSGLNEKKTMVLMSHESVLLDYRQRHRQFDWQYHSL